MDHTSITLVISGSKDILIRIVKYFFNMGEGENHFNQYLTSTTNI